MSTDAPNDPMTSRAYLGLGANWYVDDVDASVIRYWDGAGIIAEQHWTGTTWEEWWLASDGRFYPPTAQPGVVPPVPQPSMTAAGSEFHIGRLESGTAPKARPKRRRRRTLASLGGLAGVAVLAAGTVLVGTGGQQNADALVVSAVDSTLADKTATTTLTMDVSADGTDISGSGAGSVDFSQNAMNMDMSMGAGGNQMDVQLVYLGGTIYEQIPGLDQLEAGKTWVSMDLSSVASTGALSGKNSLGLEGNPSEMLRMLAQQGNTAVAIGSSTVDGVSVQGYSVTMSASELQTQLGHGTLPGWVRQELSHLSGDMVFKVYVDTEGRLRQLAISMAIGANGTNVTLSEQLDFSDYGTPVSVTAPPADQVVTFQQFVQDAAQSAANG